MTLGELQDAIVSLLEHEGIDREHRIGLEYNGSNLEVRSVTVVVSSELWETGMVVMTAGDFTEDEEGEADDG